MIPVCQTTLFIIYFSRHRQFQLRRNLVRLWSTADNHDSMFGTLRIHHKDHEVQFIDRTGSILGDGIAQRIACDLCRAKKVRFQFRAGDVWFIVLTKLQLRCSGQRTGCNRCEAAGCRCIYSPSAHGRDVRRVNKRRDLLRPKQNKGQHVGAKEKTESQQPSSTPHNPMESGGESLTGLIGYQQGTTPSVNLHKPELQHTTLGMDIVKTSPEEPSLKFPPTGPDLIGDIEALYGPSLAVANTYYSQSIAIDELWTSVTAADANSLTYPIDLPYTGLDHESTCVNYVHSTLPPLCPATTSVELKRTSGLQSTQTQGNTIFWV